MPAPSVGSLIVLKLNLVYIHKEIVFSMPRSMVTPVYLNFLISERAYSVSGKNG